MAEQLRAIGADVTRHDTNMLFVRVGEESRPRRSASLCEAQGVLINASPVVRLVTHLDVNRQQLSEVVAHWQAFYNAKSQGVSQSVLVARASGYIGQHLVRALSARAIRCWRRRHTDSRSSALPGVTCRSVDLNQAAGLALLTGIDTLYYLVHGMGEGGDFIAHERRCGDACARCPASVISAPGDISQFAAGPGAGAVRPSARSSDYRRSPAWSRACR